MSVTSVMVEVGSTTVPFVAGVFNLCMTVKRMINDVQITDEGIVDLEAQITSVEHTVNEMAARNVQTATAQLPCFQNLISVLEEIRESIEEHCERCYINRVVFSGGYKETFLSLKDRLMSCVGDITLSIVADSRQVMTEISVSTSSLVSEFKAGKQAQLAELSEIKRMLSSLQSLGQLSDAAPLVERISSKMDTNVKKVLVELQASAEFSTGMKCQLDVLAKELNADFASLKREASKQRKEDRLRLAQYHEDLIKNLAEQGQGLEKHLSAQDQKLEEIHGMLKTMSSEGTGGSSAEDGAALKLFRLIDTNSDGVISPDELMVALLGRGMDEDDVTEMLSVLDEDADGQIDQDEFLKGYSKLQASLRRVNDDRASAIKMASPSSPSSPPPGAAVLLAAEKGKVELLRKFLSKGVDVNSLECRESEDDRRTPLHKAAESEGPEYLACIQLLLDHKADVNSRDTNGWQPINVAAYEQDNLAGIRVLLEAKANPNNSVDNDDECAAVPLHAVASWPAKYPTRLDGIKLLLQYKAEVAVTDGEGQTPLHTAAAVEGNEESVRVLLQANANPNAADTTDERNTPLHCAAEASCASVIHVLLQAGVKANVKNRNKETPLHLAAAKGNTDAMEALLEAKAEVSSKDTDKETPLHAAAKEGEIEAIAMLLKSGANIKAKELNEKTALHLAAGEGHTEAIRFLLKAGADPKAKDCDGDTPKAIAKEAGEQRAYKDATAD